MKIVTIARKPVEGSTTQNVLDHGCGAINIDACRISGVVPVCTGQGFRTGKFGGKIGLGDTTLDGERWENTSGRWPANLILEHKSGCKQTGTTTTPGYTINKWDDGAKPFGGGAGHEYTSEKQPDEQVAVYECEPDCPVEELSMQSGITQSGAMKHSVGAYEGASSTGFLRGGSGPHNQRADVGTATRFFKQVQAEIPEWECEPDCPVEELNNQGGVLTSGQPAGKKHSRKGFSGSIMVGSDLTGYGDTGTAARFFKQVQTVPQELVDYLVLLISPPGDPSLIVQADFTDYSWDSHEDSSVHGLLTTGDPTEHLSEFQRVLKPGAYILVISTEPDLTGTTAACALEAAGFEIRDAIAILDKAGEFHYVAKASGKERNAGVPVFKSETSTKRYFPLPETDPEDLEELPEDWDDNWQETGLYKDQIPTQLLEFFEGRVMVDATEFQNNHATVKPVKIMEALIQDASLPKGSCIVDPFMGSGTTGVAAIKQSMSFVGIDQDLHYVTISHHRVHHADRSNAAWNAAEIESDVVEETKEAKPKSLLDFFGS